MKIDDIYPSNNARHLNPSEVAMSFIWSESFGKLIQNNHSVILGARGCGKTTLMKMLTLPALTSWPDKRAKDIRANIPFYAVYISTDIYWDVKNKNYSSHLQPFGNFSEIISIFSVNSNVFTSVCDTFENIIRLEFNKESGDKEIELCNFLIKSWKLPAIIPKIRFVKEALNSRIDEVNQLIQEIIFNYKDGDAIPHPAYFNLMFETSLDAIIPVFERIYNIVGKKKWALCFDELEFAPLWLQEKLFKSLRSRAQYIVYKLSASPILSLELENLLKGEYRATAGNDLQMIKMWTSSDNEEFSKQIIDALLYKKFNLKNAIEFFGSNDIYNKQSGSYKAGSPFYKEMTELAAKDKSFDSFLKGRKIDLTKPIPFTKEQKDTLFRKIKPIVYFRNYFIDTNKANPSAQKLTEYRSRKSAELFSGIELLTKVCDGNPRWLIGIINGILAKSTAKGASPKIQFNELFSAAKRFRNVIANIPIGVDNPNSLIWIIDRIGSFFEDQVLGSEFYMDPKGTFTVDEEQASVAKSIVTLLEKAISQGAVILLESNDDSFDFEIRGQRFKLAYLFSLIYTLPIRSYPPVKLSECLMNAPVRNPNQVTLFQ